MIQQFLLLEDIFASTVLRKAKDQALLKVEHRLLRPDSCYSQCYYEGPVAGWYKVGMGEK